ncbi:hypothetical protein LINGRAHAP2_LOCUS10005, partial [Linum grandiflorum]
MSSPISSSLACGCGGIKKLPPLVSRIRRRRKVFAWSWLPSFLRWPLVYCCFSENGGMVGWWSSSSISLEVYLEECLWIRSEAHLGRKM